MDRMTPLERELLVCVSELQASHEQQMSALRTGYETQLASLMAGFETVAASITTRLDALEDTQKAFAATLRRQSERQDAADRTLAKLANASSDRLKGLNGTLSALGDRLQALSDRSNRR